MCHSYNLMIQVKVEAEGPEETATQQVVAVKREADVEEGELSEPSDGEEWLPSNQEYLVDSDLEQEEVVKREEKGVKKGLLHVL